LCRRAEAEAEHYADYQRETVLRYVRGTKPLAIQVAARYRMVRVLWAAQCLAA